tara:strand:- start:1354 stop:2415 length:1062 start_codon:yes stop_codon:yes gene_type:complete
LAIIVNSLIIFYIFVFNIHSAENFNFTNNNVDLELMLSENKVKQINLNYDIDDLNDIEGSLLLEEKKAIFNLKSENLNFLFFDKILPKSGKKTNKTIYVNWTIDKLTISNNYVLQDVLIDLTYKSKFIELSVFDKKRSFEYFIYKNENGPSPIYLYSDNAGEILKVKKINKDIVGGKLFINGIYNNGNEYQAILKVRDFEIKKDSKYEKLIKATRIFDFVSIVNNSQTKFVYMEVPFKKEKNQIIIEDGFVVGGMVGFAFSGNKNIKTKITDIKGFYGPLYLFDRYVEKIPILNNILINNKKESLLGANFSVNSIKEETSITINPLSIITPGKTKRIFKFFDVFKKKDPINQE